MQRELLVICGVRTLCVACHHRVTLQQVRALVKGAGGAV